MKWRPREQLSVARARNSDGVQRKVFTRWEGRETRDAARKNPAEKRSPEERLACQATCRASGIRSRAAAASAGMCSDWQTWQAVSGPPVCWWTYAPPAAKYNNATQPKMANACLPEMSLAKSIFLRLYTSV